MSGLIVINPLCSDGENSGRRWTIFFLSNLILDNHIPCEQNPVKCQALFVEKKKKENIFNVVCLYINSAC